MNKGPALNPVVAASIICLIIGGIIGFATDYIWVHPPKVIYAQRPPAPGGAATTPAAAAPSGPAGGGFGGGFGGFGGPPTPTGDLTRLVRNLNTVETVQGQGITPAQAAKIAPILKKLQAGGAVSDSDAQKDVAAINATLTDSQKQALDSLNPGRRGGRGGGGGPGGAGGPGGGFGGPGGGPGGFNPNQPFAGGRNKDALDSLVAHLPKS